MTFRLERGVKVGGWRVRDAYTERASPLALSRYSAHSEKGRSPSSPRPPIVGGDPPGDVGRLDPQQPVASGREPVWARRSPRRMAR
jgi:hypothetical protein